MGAIIEPLIPDLRYRFGSEVNDEVMVTWPLELGLISAGMDELGFVLSILSDLQVGGQTGEVNFSPGLRASLGYDLIVVVAEGGAILTIDVSFIWMLTPH